MREKKRVWQGEVDRYRGRRLGVKVEVSAVQAGHEQLTTKLEPVEEGMLCLSICGDGGQNHDELADLFVGDELVEELITIWKRWHLNDLRPYTEKQSAAVAHAVKRGRVPQPVSFEDHERVLDGAMACGALDEERRPAMESEISKAATEVRIAQSTLAATRGLAGALTRNDIDAQKNPRVVKAISAMRTAGVTGSISYREVGQQLVANDMVALDVADAKLRRLREEGVVYRPGSLWLLEPLPPEVSKRLEELVHELLVHRDADSEDEDEDEDALWIEMDGERWEVDRADAGREAVASATIRSGSAEFELFTTDEEAGEAAANRWREMAESDPEEFRCMVGDEVLVAWALGKHAGPGSESAASLEDWLTDVVATHPEEEFARYDGQAREVTGASPALIEEIGFEPGVAYRSN